MNILTKTGSVLTGFAVVAFPFVALADSYSTDFESFVGTSVNQMGWTTSGTYDHAISSSLGTSGFGSKSLRISSAITSGNFGDMTFAKPLIDSVGEIDSTASTYSVGTKQRHFEVQFQIGSTMATVQPGLHMSMSPDRGDGSRMSYLRFEDHSAAEVYTAENSDAAHPIGTNFTEGIHIYFDDVQGVNPGFRTSNFVETDIATVDRGVHTVKLTMDTLDGPSNDVVKVWIDGVLKTTGTSWENYYRYDTESVAEMSPRITKTVIFRTSGDANPATLGKGFLIDNFSTLSGPTPVPAPTNKEQCKKDGWKTYTNPSFKNQGECVAYTNHN